MAVSCWFSKGWNISLEKVFNKILPNNTNYSFVWILWGRSSQKVLHDERFNELKPQTYGSPLYLFVSWVEAWRWSCLIGVRNLNLPHLKAQREVSKIRIQLLFSSLYLHLHLGEIIWQWWEMKQLLHIFFPSQHQISHSPCKNTEILPAALCPRNCVQPGDI